MRSSTSGVVMKPAQHGLDDVGIRRNDGSRRIASRNCFTPSVHHSLAKYSLPARRRELRAVRVCLRALRQHRERGLGIATLRRDRSRARAARAPVGRREVRARRDRRVPDRPCSVFVPTAARDHRDRARSRRPAHRRAIASIAGGDTGRARRRYRRRSAVDRRGRYVSPAAAGTGPDGACTIGDDGAWASGAARRPVNAEVGRERLRWRRRLASEYDAGNCSTACDGGAGSTVRRRQRLDRRPSA